MFSLDVNTDASIELTAKLEKLNKSAFPSAVRNTLNKAALNMKQKGILISAKENFSHVRSPYFFKKFTLVNKASGFDVQRMQSVVGFSDASNPSVRRVVEGLKKHEFGGMIDDGMRYLKASRTSTNYSKTVQRRNYYKKGNVITGRSGRKGTRKSKFVARMFRSKQENKPFFMNSMRGNFLVRTVSISKSRDGKINAKLKFLMMSRSKTPVRISRNKFITKAGQKEAEMIPQYYFENAQYQFKKHLS